MKLPSRIRVRTFAVAIAGVALTLGFAIGWVTHQELNSQLEMDARTSRQVAWHLRQANTCRAAEASGLPYPTKERRKLFADNVTIFRRFKSLPSDWPSEAKIHDEWGTGLQDGVGEYYTKDSGSFISYIMDFLY